MKRSLPVFEGWSPFMSIMEFKKITEIYYKELKKGYEFLKEYVEKEVEKL